MKLQNESVTIELKNNTIIHGTVTGKHANEDSSCQASGARVAEIEISCRC